MKARRGAERMAVSFGGMSFNGASPVKARRGAKLRNMPSDIEQLQRGLAGEGEESGRRATTPPPAG